MDGYVQAEGFGAAVPASWCQRCGALVLNDLLTVHDEQLHPAG